MTSISEITNVSGFKTKVENAKKDQVLIFYGNNSDRRSINRYKIFFLRTASELQKQIEVYTLNIDQVTLDPDDVEVPGYEVSNSKEFPIFILLLFINSF